MNRSAQQVVERLRTISPQDRDWLLHRLSADERRRVLTALVGEHTSTNGSAPAVGASARGTVPADDRDSEVAVLERASVREITEALASESDWTIVAMLQHQPWPWAEDYLRSLPSFKLRNLRELSDELGDSVRPKVKETVARLIGRRLLRREPNGESRSTFDVALERAQRGAHAMRTEGAE